MKKVVKCPMCSNKDVDGCALMAVEKVVDDGKVAYCCETQVKKDICK